MSVEEGGGGEWTALMYADYAEKTLPMFLKNSHSDSIELFK